MKNPEFKTAALVAVVLASTLAGCSKYGSRSCESAADCTGSSGPVTTGTVPAVATTGKLVDGYVSAATVTLDVNDDRLCSASEPTVTTDSQGNYTFPLKYGQHMVCASGGRDLATGLPFVGVLSAPAGSSVVTPLTSLVMARLNSAAGTAVAGVSSAPSAASIGSAQTLVASSLGLAGVNLLASDPVALVGTQPALLSTTAAIQTLLTQITAGTQAAAGAGSAVAGNATTNALYADALAGVASSLVSNPLSLRAAPLSSVLTSADGTATTHAPSKAAPQFGTLVSASIQAAILNSNGDASLSTKYGSAFVNLNPSLMSAFISNSLTSMMNAIATANASALLSPGANNPAELAEANVAVANTLAVLGPLVLTNAAFANGVSVGQLQDLAALAFVINANGTIGAAGSTGSTALLTALEALPGVTLSAAQEATLSTALDNANSLQNVAHVVSVEFNCLSACTAANTATLLQDQSNQASASIKGAFTSLKVDFSAVAGTAVGATQPSGIAISIYPTAAEIAAGDPRSLTLSIDQVNFSQTTTNGVSIVNGAIPAAAVITAHGVTRSGLAITATIQATATVNGQGIISFPAGGGSMILNINALLNVLGGTNNAPFDILTGLNQGGESGESFQIDTSFAGLTLSTLSAVAPVPSYDFNMLISFQ